MKQFTFFFLLYSLSSIFQDDSSTSRVLSGCRKSPPGLSDRNLQSAARTPCAPTAHNSHTCSLRCIFCQVHALTENDSEFIRCSRSELCEAFSTVCQHQQGAVFYIHFPERSIYLSPTNPKNLWVKSIKSRLTNFTPTRTTPLVSGMTPA